MNAPVHICAAKILVTGCVPATPDYRRLFDHAHIQLFDADGIEFARGTISLKTFRRIARSGHQVMAARAIGYLGVVHELPALRCAVHEPAAGFVRHAEEVRLAACRHGHLHLELRDGRGHAIAVASMSHEQFSRLTGDGEDVVCAIGSDPIPLTNCEDRA